MRNDSARELVYGVLWEERLIFMQKDRAAELATFQRALRTAETWGELRAQVSPAQYREALERYSDELDDDDEVVVPLDDDEFDPAELVGFEESDWPRPPFDLMLDWVPPEIQERFGETAYSALGQEWLQLDPADAADIIAAFEGHGYRCSEDQALIVAACGDL